MPLGDCPVPLGDCPVHLWAALCTFTAHPVNLRCNFTAYPVNLTHTWVWVRPNLGVPAFCIPYWAHVFRHDAWAVNREV